jgi:hypothetical protein
MRLKRNSNIKSHTDIFIPILPTLGIKNTLDQYGYQLQPPIVKYFFKDSQYSLLKQRRYLSPLDENKIE